MGNALDNVIRSRYERKVISGTKVVHDGDCGIWQAKICTCGLLHLLNAAPDARGLYPPYEEEKSNHDRGLDFLQRNPVPPVTEEDVKIAEKMLQDYFGIPIQGHQMTYPTYDPKTRTCICPIVDRDDDHTLDNMKRIGIKILKQIELPFEFNAKFYYCMLPEWLSLDEEDVQSYSHGSFLEFKDKQNRSRLRVMLGLPMSGTVVFTRYAPTWDHTHINPAVRDAEKIHGDEEFVGDEGIIWKTERMGSFDPFSEASKWLDQHYPDWRDPMAYWTND